LTPDATHDRVLDVGELADGAAVVGDKIFVKLSVVRDWHDDLEKVFCAGIY
jgi:hypothetical protein